MQDNTYRSKGKRNAKGKIGLSVPLEILQKKCHQYQRHGKPIHRQALTSETEYCIVARYQTEYRGLVEYYQLANNLRQVNRLKWVMEQWLTQTLASKLQLPVTQVYRQFKTTLVGADKKVYHRLQVRVPRAGKKPRVARWGGLPLRRKSHPLLNDQPPPFWIGRSELEKRLLAATCELCGSRDRVNVHHSRVLKDLNQKGRREKAGWMKVMASRKRKTLIVCWTCHSNPCGLGPPEIVRFCPQEWSDVQEIYRLRRIILERLLNNANLLRSWLND